MKLRGAGKILSTIQHGKNLDDVNYFNLKEDEINLCFKIFTYLKDKNFEGVNFSYLEKYFNIDKKDCVKLMRVVAGKYKGFNIKSPKLTIQDLQITR